MRASIETIDRLGIDIRADQLWVASDVHGMRTPFVEALRTAGLINTAERWCAPAGTALVVLGDAVDRGADSVGVLRLLFALTEQAPARRGAVILLRGNHEAMMTESLVHGDEDMYSTWLTYGGRNTLTSLGVDAHGRSVRRGPTALHHAVRAAWPGLLERLERLPEWARWGDVLLTHGGPVPSLPLERWAPNGWHLWQRQRWQTLTWEDSAWDVYREAGLERFVMGHTPMDGIKTFLDGRLLAIDTNACGVWDSRRSPIGCELSLAQVPRTGSMRSARSITVDTSEAPERFVPIGQFKVA